MKYFKVLSLVILTLVYSSCTKLEEGFKDQLEVDNSGSVTAAQLLTTAYNSLNGPYQYGNPWHMQEHASDELMGPTRGPDWDDNGQWRALHAHTWNADHGIVTGGFSDLLSAQFNASQVLAFSPNAQQAAEARFIRALTIFTVADLFDQVPYRENLTDYKLLPVTLKGTEAADFVISEINAIIGDLPDTGPAYAATKNAAKVLLMKVYLNKGAFANRAAPTFDAADMAQVITLADQLIATGKYSISAAGKYFDNFAPNNDIVSTENIYTLLNKPGERGGNVRGSWFQIAHYSMNPAGWNGFATLGDFYDKYEASDERRGKNYVYPGMLPNPAGDNTAGYFVGQQHDYTSGAALKDRQGAPLAFTKAVSLRETGTNLEVTGIRPMKYPYDYGTNGDQKDNDWALFRYSDVLLMKAEALLRSGGSGADAIVNSIRTARGATTLGTVDLAALLDERGRELFQEGWRREDLIRFGKYLEPWAEKANPDDPKNLLYPIPSNQLAVNPNLVQNPGYQ